ncbi:hypothetical protein KA082_00095 [Candidatus Woesebacteria bacterium]|nr:hypothetical protein [Candidatus Woesebacteria bacterium]
MTPDTNDQQLDQTRFSLEEPMYEEYAKIPVDPSAKKVEIVQPLLKRKGVVVGIIVGGVIVLFLIILLLSVLLQAKKLLPGVIDTPIQSQSTDVGGPLGERLQNLKAELKKADPNKSELAFPAVDFSIKIDDEEKR